MWDILQVPADPTKALPVQSLSYGAANPHTGGSHSKPQLSSLSVQMDWFPQELPLFSLLTTDQPLTHVIILVTSASQPATVCRTITLDNVTVSSLQESMGSGGSASVAIAFTSSTITLATLKNGTVSAQVMYPPPAPPATK